jgi:hypothetical protein
VRSSAPIWHRLRWPREVKPEQVAQVFRLLATAAGTPVVIEAVGSPGMVEHRLALPAGRAEGVVDQLRAAIPGLHVEEVPTRPPMDVSHAVELRLSTKKVFQNEGSWGSVLNLWGVSPRIGGRGGALSIRDH